MDMMQGVASAVVEGRSSARGLAIAILATMPQSIIAKETGGF